MDELTRIARTATLEEVIAGNEANKGGEVGLSRAVDDLHAIRPPECVWPD